MAERSVIGYSCVVLGVCLAACGCQPEAESEFTARAEVAELPKLHQEGIASGLETYFGKQSDPRFMLAAPELPDAPEQVKLTAKFDPLHLRQGREVYARQCAGCHGVTGDGQGPAAQYLNPPPRDYRLGRFKFTSTPRGAKPRRADLERVIRRGAKGTSMPAFRWISQEDLDAVADYVTLLSSRGELEYLLTFLVESELDETDPVDALLVAENAALIETSWEAAESQIVQPPTPPPAYNEQSIEVGARAFVRLSCYKCHGFDGRGNKTQDVGKDDWGRVAYAADLTTGTLHGGRRPIDIYRRIYSGINATPMPGFSLPDTAKGETELDRSAIIWNLTHFVTSIVEGHPLPTDVIDAEISEQLKNLPPAEPAAAPVAGGG